MLRRLERPGLAGRRLVVATAALPVVAVAGVLVAHASCVRWGFAAGVMGSCGTTGPGPYLALVADVLRLPLALGLASGLTLLAMDPAEAAGPPGRRRVRQAVAVVAGIGAAAPTLGAAAREGAVRGTLDFLWSSIDAFWARRPIYAYYAGCGGGGLEAECNAYLHPFPVLLGPFAALSPERAFPVWAAVNVLLVVGAALAVAIGFDLSPLRAFALALALAVAGSTENVILNGQVSLLVLVLVVGAPLIVRRRDAVAGVLAGLAMFKVSLFVPFLGLLWAARPRAALWSVGVIGGSAVFAAAWLDAPVLETLLGPVIIPARGFGTWYAEQAGGDVPRLLADLGLGPAPLVSAGLGLLALVIPVLVHRRSADPLAGTAAAAVAALVLFPHFPYDYILALPILALGLARLPDRRAAGLAIVAAVLLLTPSAVIGRLTDVADAPGLAEFSALFAWPMAPVAARVVLVLNLIAAAAVLSLALGGPRSAAGPSPRTPARPRDAVPGP